MPSNSDEQTAEQKEDSRVCMLRVNFRDASISQADSWSERDTHGSMLEHTWEWVTGRQEGDRWTSVQEGV